MDKLENARAIIDAHSSNDWDGSDPIDKFADARFAVVIERESDSWVVAARDIEQVAVYGLACYAGTEGYDEWIDSIFDLDTGEEIASWQSRLTYAVTIGDERAEASQGPSV